MKPTKPPVAKPAVRPKPAKKHWRRIVGPWLG